MDKKWVILIVFSFFYLLGMIGVAWGAYESVDPDASNAFLKTTKVVLLMFGGMGVILPTYINIWNSVESAKFQEYQDSLKKADNAFDLLRQWDDDALRAARNLTRELKEDRRNLSDHDIEQKIENCPETMQSVILLFNYFDLIRMSIKSGRVSDTMIRDSIGETAIDIIDRFRVWIEKQSEAYQEHIRELRQFLS